MRQIEDVGDLFGFNEAAAFTAEKLLDPETGKRTQVGFNEAAAFTAEKPVVVVFVFANAILLQ